MSNISQFFGTGTSPVGAYILAVDSNVNFQDGPSEYLRTGNIKAYDASYSNTSPKLRVFGSDTATKGTNAGASYWYFSYFNNRYVSASFGNLAQWTTDFSTWNNSTGTSAQAPYTLMQTANHLCTATVANTAPSYTTDGMAWSAVGGTFTTFPAPTAQCFGNNIWLTLSSLNNTPGGQAYIANANPSGTWTVGTGANLGMTTVKGVAFGNGVFCAVGTSSSATAGKIATCTSPAVGWTDRTSSTGITFLTTDSISDVVFSGTNFVAIGNTALIGIITSSDGITWTKRQGNLPAVVPLRLVSDGNGKVIAYSTNAGSSRIHVSTDHGITWNSAQVYTGKAAITATHTISFANGKFLDCHAGDHRSVQDLGSLTTPDYVGDQVTVTCTATSSANYTMHVRIK